MNDVVKKLIPIAWYVMNQWLADFAYRIEIGPGIFALAGGTALVIALIAVIWQSIKAYPPDQLHLSGDG